MKAIKNLLTCTICLFLSACCISKQDASVRITVSENNHYLQYEDGTPFFYLADTAWELFHRLTREEADMYLEDRAAKGFTVIQAVALAELDGIRTPNAYGYTPFIDNDPLRPAVNEGPDNDYWDNVDYIVDKANSLGLFVAMLPTWGCHWKNEPILNKDNAGQYSKWLAERYKDKNIIWILGGDRVPDNENQYALAGIMAEGLRAGDGGIHLITYHTNGATGTYEVFGNADWLSFNFRQNGHNNIYEQYSKTLRDFCLTPAKPVIDGEPIYEAHPINFDFNKGYSNDSDCRRALYWDLFNGACGHTYGCHAIWQMFDQGRGPINRPLATWKESLTLPGSSQMQYAKHLLLSRPFFTRVPLENIVSTSFPIEDPDICHFSATGDTDGTYLMVYAPKSVNFSVDTKTLKDKNLIGWWYNPRNGVAVPVGEFENGGSLDFSCPDEDFDLDWILVLDGASNKYPAPGMDTYN